MSLFVWPQYRPVDTNGDPVPGGKLNFYASGTSTPQDTYTEQTLTTPHANPVVADANGTFAAIWLSDTLEYKVVFTDASDNIIWTQDTWDGAQQVGASGVAARLAQVASNPLDQGAVGDGEADETTEVQAAIDAATRVVDLLGKTYLCDSALSGSGGLTYKNGTLDFSNCTDLAYFTLTGSVGTYTDLTGDAAYMDDYVSATSVAGLTSGDIVNLISSGTYCASGQQGELCRIRDISTLDVYMTSEILDAYTTANTARLAKVTTIDDVVFENVTFIANNAVATANTRIIDARATNRLRFRNCRFVGIKKFAIVLAGCADTVIEGCEFIDGGSGSVGILPDEATQDLTIRECAFREVATGVDMSSSLGLSTVPLGIRRKVRISGNTFEQSETTYGTAISIGADAQDVHIENNTITGGHTTAQMQVRCADALVRGNTIDSGSGLGIQAYVQVPNNTGRGYSLVIRDNNSRGSGSDIDYRSTTVSGGAGALDRVVIADNNIDQGEIVATAQATSANVGSLQITGNTTAAINIDGANATISGTRCVNNIVAGTRSELIKLDTLADAVVIGNKVTGESGSGAYGIHLLDVQGGVVAGNHVFAYDSGIRIENPNTGFSGVSVSGNYVKCDDGGVAMACLLVASTVQSNDLTVTGNEFLLVNPAGASYVVGSITGIINGGSISGNTFRRDDDAESNLYIAGTAAGNITNFRISGNVFREGTYGIIASNCTNTFELGNIISSMATANTSGTVSGALSTYGEASSDETGLSATGDGTGSGVYAIGGATGYGLIAQADTSSPVRAALRMVPQDTAPSSPQRGDVFSNSVNGALEWYDGGAFQRGVGQSSAQAPASDTRAGSPAGAFSTTYTIPAGRINRAGASVRIVAFGDTTSAAGAGTHVSEIRLGPSSTVICTMPTVGLTSTPGEWWMEAWIIVPSTGTSVQLTTGGTSHAHDAGASPTSVTHESRILTTQNLENALAIDVLCTGSSASDTFRLLGLIVDIA